MSNLFGGILPTDNLLSLSLLYVRKNSFKAETNLINNWRNISGFDLFDLIWELEFKYYMYVIYDLYPCQQ